MSAEIFKLDLVHVPKDYRFNSDEVLDRAKGQKFKTFAILGELEDGTIWISGNANAGETLFLIEKAKHNIVFGEDE